MNDTTEPRNEPDEFSTPLGHFLGAVVVPALFRSDAELARAIGTSQANVSRWRTGTKPSMPMLVQLAAATGVSVETLGRIAAYTPEGSKQ